MLKNWIVKTKQIKNKDKGFQNHVDYLTDKNRASHHFTTIEVLTNNSENILKAIEERQVDRREKGLRGGGVCNYCTSFILSLPSDIQQPNKREWNTIVHKVYKRIARETGLPPKVIRDHAFAVLHDESEAPDKCSHVHLLVSNVINKCYQKKITQRSVTFAVKKGLNEGVLSTVGESNYAYKPKRRQKFNKPAWIVRAEKMQLIESKITELKQVYLSVIDSIKQWSANYLLSLPSPSEKYANHTATGLDMLSNLSTKSEQALNPVISSVEDSNTAMPENTKVTPKRKRRRRNRK